MTEINSSRNHDTFVRLKVVSEGLTPDGISTFLGIDPDKIWNKGDYKGYPTSSMIAEKNNGWILNSGRGKEESLELHIESLLNRLALSTERIRVLAEENDVTISCAVYMYSEETYENPPLYFDKDTLSAMCALGASFDIQLYFLGDASNG